MMGFVSGRLRGKAHLNQGQYSLSQGTAGWQFQPHIN